MMTARSFELFRFIFTSFCKLLEMKNDLAVHKRTLRLAVRDVRDTAARMRVEPLTASFAVVLFVLVACTARSQVAQ
jgi:hypothetical protein